MKHTVASRFNDEYKDDRCPKCGLMTQNFIKVSEVGLACYRCGTQFISYNARKAMLSVSKQMLIEQGEDRSEWRCECGFLAKNKAGLVAHKRTCKK